jgi:hypothetical protein
MYGPHAGRIDELVAAANARCSTGVGDRREKTGRD